ncbi:neurexin protein binding [Homalodisca vitripennis]|nr:neurexin protein binding [Homalodisca vitripennis]
MFVNNVYSHHLNEIFSVISCCRMFINNVYSHHLKEIFSVISCCRMFVNNVYSHHLKEIFSAVRNEYSEWNETADTPLIVRDSLLLALSDGLTAAPLVKLAYLHSRRGSTTYLFHLSHQVDKDLRSLVRNTLYF